MQQFTNAEIVDMHLACGLVYGNGIHAARLHAERYTNRRVPHHQMFGNLHRNPCEYETFYSKHYAAQAWKTHTRRGDISSSRRSSWYKDTNHCLWYCSITIQCVMHITHRAFTPISFIRSSVIAAWGSSSRCGIFSLELGQNWKWILRSQPDSVNGRSQCLSWSYL